MTGTKKHLKDSSGFTLVELMVVVVLTALAVISIYRGYTAFSQSADAQEQILEMQQNLRIGMYLMEKEIRRGEMDEEDNENAGFEIASSFKAVFSMDLTGGQGDGKDNDNDGVEDEADESIYGDGDVDDAGERIEFRRDTNSDGIFGLYRRDLNSGADVEIISNVSALGFVYLDKDNTPLLVADADTSIQPEAGSLDEGQMDDIKAVQVSLVVETTNEDYRYTDNEPYENINPDGAEQILGPQNDNKRRRILNKQIKIRNAGL